MKRLLHVAAAMCVAVAAIAPALAAAERDHLSASAKGDFSVDFKAVYVDGKPKQVKHFKFKQVELTCDVGGPVTTSSKAPHFGPMHVNGQRRFHGNFDANGGDVRVTITGEFKGQDKARGTLKIDGDYTAEGASGCHSGKLEWLALLS